MPLHSIVHRRLKICIIPDHTLIPARPWRRSKHHRGSDDWLPFDHRALETVETASFWEMVDREHRLEEDDCLEQGELQQSHTCTQAEMATEDHDNDQNDTSSERQDGHVGPMATECFVPEGGPGTLPCIEITTHMTGVEATGKTIPDEASTTAEMEKTETTSTEDTGRDVNRSRAPLCPTPASPIVLICFLFVFLYVRFGGQSLLEDLTRGFTILFCPYL